nr:MAG TPA: Protein of unknown function (DUF434) [Bacteriophage sp.]
MQVIQTASSGFLVGNHFSLNSKHLALSRVLFKCSCMKCSAR